MAKARPKQAVDYVDSFCYPINDFTLKEFIDVFQRKLPVVIAVTEGFYGIDDMHSIASEEVYRIEKIVKQPRIVLRQNNGTVLSIPEDYKFSKFQFIRADGRGGLRVSIPMTLKQIIREQKYHLNAIKIQLENDSEAGFLIGNEEKSCTSLGPLEYMDRYEEKYLVGFSIIQGKLSAKALAIPVYVDIKVSTVTDTTKDATTKLEVFLRKLSPSMEKACEKVELNEVISILPEGYDSESDYEYIIPNHYMTLKIMERQNSRQPRPPIPRPLSSEYLSKEVSLPRPPLLPRRHSTAEQKSSRQRRNPPLRSSLSLPLPEPPKGSVNIDYHSYTKLMPLQETENPYGSRPIYNSLADVPVNLAGLSKYRIADCLRLLNLQNHSDRFIKESVDGNLITELDEKMLQQHFNFTKFEAIKLMGFVRGWRPNEEET